VKYIDGFREPAAAAALRERIGALGRALTESGRTANLMEVCGTHTMAIARYGIRNALPPGIRLISGPGCPVCVTEPGYLDAAIELAGRGVTVATFGDLMHVPGSESSLAEARAGGRSVVPCYSPTVAMELAAERPDREVVFLAVGFETTIGPEVSVVALAEERGLRNLSLLTAFKLVPPALQALRADPEIRIDAFLCPAHVSAIIGADAYLPFAGPGGVPCVIAGFEPLDILLGLAGILEQLVHGEARVDNQYARVVKPRGNVKAQALMNRYLEPADVVWRGLGLVPGSGLALRPEYASYDAARRHGVGTRRGREHPGCRCGDVIKGKIEPGRCPLFGGACTPDRPVGPCMVSAEGSCAAAFKYAAHG
jgi:hydrogenase expression/formation protein HypD